MPYFFYLDGMQLPFAPPSMRVSRPGRNETIDLINDGEANILRAPGLEEFEFEARIPQQQYSFATYPGGWIGAGTFGDRMRAFQDAKTPFRFIVSRTMPDGNPLFDTNLMVSLEEFEEEEDAEEGFDVIFSLALKAHKAFATRTVQILPATTAEAAAVAVVTPARPVSITTPSDYTVVKGDCLSHIAARTLGDSSRWREIYELNKSQIREPNLIFPGQVFKLPQGGTAHAA